MRPTILLWDIDGTLISSGGAGRRAMEQAFVDALGSAAPVQSFEYAGMTDKAIIRRGLENAGRPTLELDIDRVLETYLEHLATEIPKAPDYRVFPGVQAALDRAREQRGVVQGLGTGNVARGATIKLARGGLDGYFAFGGFGSDDEDRPTLIKIGIERGARALGLSPRDCRVVVIGDTPRDVHAARENGVECLAVATGPHSVEALRDAGARWAVTDMTAPEALACLLG